MITSWGIELLPGKHGLNVGNRITGRQQKFGEELDYRIGMDNR